ncbi:MAG: ABC transporter permease [Chloroflexia bacterium]
MLGKEKLGCVSFSEETSLFVQPDGRCLKKGVLDMGSFVQAIHRLLAGDPELWGIILLSLRVSGTALLIGALLGVPLGAFLGLKRFFGRRLVIALLYTGMGLPPVVVGLLVYLLFSRSGPLGFLGWLFTPRAMVLAQTLICLPVIVGFAMAAVLGVDPALRQQLRALGATAWQSTWAVVREARTGIIVALVAGFGSIISEVGAVMLVGGNIQGSTRVLTTAIVLETRQGHFDTALAFGLVLLLIAFAINGLVLALQGKSVER